MAGTNLARHGGTAFDSFLYADVGTDRNGNAVSVLSALARLGFDPWDAATDLAKLKPEAARTRLGGLLARFCDVPALGGNHGSIAQRLVGLLPAESGQPEERTTSASPPAAVVAGRVFAILMVLLFLAQAFFLGSSGSGD